VTMTMLHQREGGPATEPLRETVDEQWQRARTEARGLGSEVAEIAMDLRVLAQKEVELARVEMKQELSRAARSLAWGFAAAVFAVLVLSFLAWTLLLALAEVFQPWLAALVTAAVLAVITAAAGFMAYERFSQITVVPRRTVQSLQEDMAWAREQIKSSAR
jgi:uncharacterized membrane protein YqjE